MRAATVREAETGGAEVMTSLSPGTSAGATGILPDPTRRELGVGSGNPGGTELHADPRPDRLRRLQDGVLPGALARAAHHHQVTVSQDRKSTRLNSSHVKISYAVFC